ncbi:MAG TPA: hypothetical protein VJH03_15060 [Blastocatellia bacterium]|nr:hypothetical protein [Blastocatellia bacterium]
MICHHCKCEIKVERFVARGDECPHCGEDAHCCLNCHNYDPSAHNRCREPQAEWVADRERANFCDFFIPNKLSPSGKPSDTPDVRKAFDDLFKK